LGSPVTTGFCCSPEVVIFKRLTNESSVESIGEDDSWDKSIVAIVFVALLGVS